jgi:phosphoribosylaminoimidazole carboxylase (NCAIR synthetase)
MPEARISSKGYSLIYLIRPSVYSSRYLHELQTYLAKFELNLTAIIGHNSEKTYSSIDGSILLNILGKDVQTEPPNRIDAKAIDVIYSVVRYSAYS